MNDKYQTPEELLDSILFGESSEEEIIAAVSDEHRTSFLHDLNLHRSAAVLIQHQDIIGQVKSVEHAFLQKRRQQSNNNNVRSISGKNVMKVFMAVAAVFLVTATVIVLYWYNGNTSERLYGQHYQTYQLNVERSGNTTTSAITSQYQQKAYDQVIAAHEKNAVSATRDKMVVASAYMELNRYDAAITMFRDIISGNLTTGSRLYHDEAEYYLALAYMKSKQYDNAYQLFNKIYADKEHTFNGDVDWWFLTRVKWLK